MALFKRNPTFQAEQEVQPADPAPQFMNLEGLLEGVHGVVSLCEVPDQQIKGGRRAIRLPDGVLELSDHAFDSYNLESETVRSVQDIHNYNYRALELEKQIVQKRIPARKFPRELKSVREKRDYLLWQEEQERLLRLYLPNTLTSVHRHSFPVLLEAIEVCPDHPVFRSIGGVLFSRDSKTLLRYPGLQNDRDYAIPDGVEQVATGAFEDAILDTLTLPGSLRALGPDSFAGLRAKRVVLSEGIEIICSGSFAGSHIEQLVLPASLERIEQEAFRQLRGLKELEQQGTELELGPCLFRECTLDDVSWWPWSYIPRATFLNSRLQNISLPDGVEDIGPYAFAGCYTAKSVQLPGSVHSVGVFAFDLGPTYNRPITLPEHLFPAICRFPARSPVNKRGRESMFRRFEESGSTERRDILEAQIAALETMPPLQKKLYPSLRRELDFYRRQLAQVRERP